VQLGGVWTGQELLLFGISAMDQTTPVAVGYVP
jgi:hypothetical protein